MERKRDANGRFIKKDKSTQKINDENDSVHQLTRAYNRIADGGEPTLEDARRECRLQQWSLRTLAFVFICFLMWLILAGCNGPKVVTEYVTVENRTTETIIVRDTVLEVKLIQSRDSVVTPDTVSTLQNPYCISTAGVKDGLLLHTLATKAGAKASGEVKYKERIIVDSIPYPVEVPGPTQYIEHNASWWETTFMVIGMVVSALLIISLLKRLKIFA